jgi:hypothetical protein
MCCSICMLSIPFSLPAEVVLVVASRVEACAFAAAVLQVGVLTWQACKCNHSSATTGTVSILGGLCRFHDCL